MLTTKKMSKKQILKDFELFRVGIHGIGAWLTDKTDEKIFKRLDKINKEPLSIVQFNQLLALGQEAPLSQGFFEYYWLEISKLHPYPLNKLTGYDSSWFKSKLTHIVSLTHLR